MGRYFVSRESVMPGNSPRFLLNGDWVDGTSAPAQTTLLEYLRGGCHLIGTMEGCADGDCGACTIVPAAPDRAGPHAWLETAVATNGSPHARP